MTTRLFRPGFPAVLVALFAAAEAVAQDPADPPPGNGTNEGIAVHGDWTITIVRDGEVVERREFENALTPTGARHLARVLAGENTTGHWFVGIHSTTALAVPLCDGVIPSSNTCHFREGDELTVSTPDADDTLVLEGSAVAQGDAELADVSTSQNFCSSDTAPTDCTFGSDSGTLTAVDLSPHIPVQEGDVIDVTVVLSFN